MVSSETVLHMPHSAAQAWPHRPKKCATHRGSRSSSTSKVQLLKPCAHVGSAAPRPGDAVGHVGRPTKLKQKHKPKTDRTSCQTQAGIGHSAPAHRGGHVQNKSRRREQRRGRYRTEPQLPRQPRVDGRPSSKARAHHHGRGRMQPGARRRRPTKQERRDKSQTLQLHVPRGVTSHGRSRVEEEQDKTSRGSHNRCTVGRKRCR